MIKKKKKKIQTHSPRYEFIARQKQHDDTRKYSMLQAMQYSDMHRGRTTAWDTRLRINLKMNSFTL